VTDLAKELRPIDSPDSLDTLLDYLRQSNSPITGVLELRSILLAQKEEKIELRGMLEQERDFL